MGIEKRGDLPLTKEIAQAVKKGWKKRKSWEGGEGDEGRRVERILNG